MRVATINGVTKISAGESQRRRRRMIALSVHRFKQAVFFGACILCSAFGLRCMTLETQLADYRIALADMKAYQIAHGISFENESEDPQLLVERYKAQIDKASNDLAKADVVWREDQELQTKLNMVMTNMSELDMQNATLIQSNEDYYQQLQAFQNRQELYDKYSYALYNQLGERNDITFEQLKTGEDIMIAGKMDPNILWGFICAESDGNEKAKNPSSTAAGYGQILASTGRNVYENIMGNGKGTFTSDMLLDGDINITIASNYLVYLRNTSSDIYEVIDKYAGEHNEGYYKKLDRVLQKGGTSLAQINENTFHATEPLEASTNGSVELMIADAKE